MAELLKPNLLLTELQLARNDLDAEAVEALAGPLAHHDMLVALDLSVDPVPDKMPGTSWLSSSITICTHSA